MQFARQFANSVVLPNGEVMIIGGNTSGLKFNDTGSILTPEIWNPRTGTWRTRREHGGAARIITPSRCCCPMGACGPAAVGWVGNAADHQDAQIFTPPALFQFRRHACDAAR